MLHDLKFSQYVHVKSVVFRITVEVQRRWEGGGGGQCKIRQFERDLRSKITIEHPLLSHLGAPAAQARRRGQKLLRPRAYQQIISGKISFGHTLYFKLMY